MANNRLVAVCLYDGCNDGMPAMPRNRKTIMKYYPSAGWFAVDGNDEWFAQHKHGGLFGNYIAFVPEIRGAEELNGTDDADLALALTLYLHGKDVE